MTARNSTRSSWARFLAALLILWMLLVPLAAMAGGEDDPGGMGSVEEAALSPADGENSSSWVDWLLWLLSLQILP